MDGKLINVAVGGTGSFWFLTLITGRQRRIYHDLYKFQTLICSSHVRFCEQSREIQFHNSWGPLTLIFRQLFARFRVMATALSIRSRPEVKGIGGQTLGCFDCDILTQFDIVLICINMY